MNELEKKINRMQDKLILLANKVGFTHTDTVWCSQELDKLIVKYQRMMNGEDRDNSHTSSAENLLR